MVNINRVFNTQAEAETFKATTLNRYHPAGYGTSLDIHKTHDGRWAVTGYRYSSCD